MDRATLFSTLNEYFNYGAQDEIEKTIQKHIDENEIEVACEDIAEYIYDRYSSSNADAMAALMEMAIRHNREIALVKFPNNYLFHLILLTGSLDLYECFMEEAIEPHLEGKHEDETADYYTELYAVANDANEKYFSNCKQYRKGIDFDGAFGRSEENPSITNIHKEDYEKMKSVIEKYNAIIGRRDILADLEERY